MRNLVKLLLLVALSVSVVSGSELEKVFGLKDQEFAEVTVNKLNKYKMSDNLIFGMQMSKIDSYDGYGGKYWNMIFKKPSFTDWAFIEKIWLYGDMNQLTFTDENGLELIITVKSDDIAAGDRITNSSVADRKQVLLKVLFINHRYTVYVNGDKLYSSKKRFSKLKSINQKTRYKGLDSSYADKLINITLNKIQ